MADKASRSLVLFGDGLGRFIDPSSSSHTHLHSLASLSSCGFLTLPNSPPSESEDERIVREFAVLLDASQTHSNVDGELTSQNDPSKQTLPDRFMGMKGAILANHSGLKSFSAKLGFSVIQLDELVKECAAAESQDSDAVAVELLKLLGFQEGKVMDNNQFDLVFFHVGAGEKANGCGQNADVEYIDALVGGIMRQAQPGSDVSSRLHLSLVMSYGKVLEDDESKFPVSKRVDENNSYLSLLYPLQSYAMKGGVPRKDVRHHSPMLIAQWQHAVTRKDNAQRFSFQDFMESKPKAAYWKNTRNTNYEKMVILYGNDRATGEEAKTASEMRKRGHFIESIDDIHNSGARKKKKTKVAMHEVVEALREGNAVMREGNAIMREGLKYMLPPISGEEVWNLIKECGCNTNLLPKIFCSLMKDVVKLRAILQCPAEARNAVIMQMVFGSSDPPSY